jgi:hypothetical protein
MKQRLSEQAVKTIRELRSKGYSLTEIKKEVKAGYGTIYNYIKDVQILPEYKEVWEKKRNGSMKRKIDAETEAGVSAKKILSNLSENEKLLFAVALYWAEGSKKDFSFCNSDPEMIQIFVAILKNVFKVRVSDLKISIRIYEDLDMKKCSEFWASLTGIKVDEITSVNVLKGKKVGKLTYGMCRVRVKKGGDLLKYVVALRKVFIEILPL